MRTHSMDRQPLLAALAVAGTTGLSACSTSSQEPTTASPSTSLVGGTAVCDEASLRSAIEASYSEEGADTKLLRVNEFECSEGWAVVFPDVGTNEENAVTVTEVLEAEGQFWLVKNREDGVRHGQRRRSRDAARRRAGASRHLGRRLQHQLTRDPVPSTPGGTQ